MEQRLNNMFTFTLHDALPISRVWLLLVNGGEPRPAAGGEPGGRSSWTRLRPSERARMESSTALDYARFPVLSEIGREHVLTPVTWPSLKPYSDCTKQPST